jgi:hypothetical protein
MEIVSIFVLVTDLSGAPVSASTLSKMPVLGVTFM